MTLLPVEQARITVPEKQDWPSDPVSRVCQRPGCDKPAAETHEVVRRSFTAGKKDWVSVDGLVLPNTVRLCQPCHRDVTEHRAWIRYEEGEAWTWWELSEGGTISVSDRFVQHEKSGRTFRRVGALRD